MSTLTKQPAPAICYQLETSDTDLASISTLEINRMLMLLHLIREFETKLLELKDADLVHGPVHASIGQEAVAAAVAVALRKSDMVASTHRAHGHFLSKAWMYYAPDDYDPLTAAFTPQMQNAVNKTLAEIMGLKDGWCGGRGGSMHLYDGESGNLGSNAIVGGGIPIATGAAWAQTLQKTDNVVVSFFGDGAINQGCFHEVANMATLWRVPVLYLVENNLYAVGTCTLESSCVEDLAQRTLGYGFGSLIVDGMDPVSMYIAVKNSVGDMRKRAFPFLIEAKTYRYYHHGGGIIGSAFGYRSKDEEAEWLSKDPLKTFPERLLALERLTPEVNQQFQDMAVASVKEAVRFCTAEENGNLTIPLEKWPLPESAEHDIRYEGDVFEGVTFVEKEDFSIFKPMTYNLAISSTTLRAMERDERVIVLGEEVANLRGGAYSATRGIKEVYPERLFNTPISETGFIGMAGGLAAVGMRPVVEVMFPDFALMSSDQLFNQIGKLRHMYGGQVKFPLLLRTRIAMGFGYGGQHSMDPSAVFALFSGWRIMAPSNAFDYVGMFNTAMRFQDPVLIVEHGQLYAEEGEVPENNPDYCVQYGKAKVVRPGSDVTVLTYLLSVKHCLQVAEELAAEGVSAEIIDLRTLDYTGMDYDAIGKSVRKTGSVLIVE
ncbi:MAG: thiamine pyrophosphate-dependent enzyme, partial [Anaerolineae bacterium]|nr:thiamine pyrophosphate-dependent enzyme [Anaerolineae bacterium]